MFHLPQTAGKMQSRRRFRARPRVEHLEPRDLPAPLTWNAGITLPEARGGIAAAMQNGAVAVFDGSNADVPALTVSNPTWQGAYFMDAFLPAAVDGPGVGLLPDGTALVFGGQLNGTATNTATDYDYTGDGWTDILVVDSRPIYLYVNPKGEPRRWDRYNVVPNSTSEINLFRDIDGDGKPEVLFTAPGAVMAYAKPDPANPTAPWRVHNISDQGLAGPHGMGMGDINGDGRMDVVNSRGWWEQPAGGAAETSRTGFIRRRAWTWRRSSSSRWGQSRHSSSSETACPCSHSSSH